MLNLAEGVITTNSADPVSNNLVAIFGTGYEKNNREVVPGKAISTQDTNRKDIKKLLLVFGKMNPESIKSQHVAEYLDTRGNKAPVKVNKEIGLLSHMFTKTIRWDVAENNPCRGVERNKETSRDRYVEDWELKEFSSDLNGALFWKFDKNSFSDRFVTDEVKTIFNSATIAQRLLAGFTNTNVIQYWYYLGGLDRIRGYTDNRFAGRKFLLSNTELRYPVIQTNHYVVQASTFVDLLSSGEETKDLASLSGASMGLGLRIILPKFYRMTLRFDWATQLLKKDDQNFSFGVQHFF